MGVPPNDPHRKRVWLAGTAILLYAMRHTRLGYENRSTMSAEHKARYLKWYWDWVEVARKVRDEAQ